MQFLRQLRKTMITGGLRLGMEWSRRANDPTAVEVLRVVARGVTRAAIPLRAYLATNMKLTGVYRPALIDAHFERAIDQLIMLAHVFRAGLPTSGCLEKFAFDDSFRFLEQAYAAGKGVINVAPHLCGYPVYPGVLTQRIPCSIYLRRNKDPRKMSITEAIGLAGGGHLVAPPENATRAQRLQVAMDVLRQGRMLFITADTLRKPGEGVPVTLFGRTAHFPNGVYVMSMRTGAPVVPTVWHWENGAYRIRYGAPVELPRIGRIKEQTEAATRTWAQSVDAFLREHPEMWWNWLDNRWTRIIRAGPDQAGG